MNLRKILSWLIAGLVVLYVIQFPDNAGHIVRSAAGGLAVVGASLMSFVGSMV